MTVLMVALTIAVAILTLLVAGLLRSHAAILERLHQLDGGDGPATTPAPAGSDDAEPGDALPRPAATAPGRVADDIAGMDPSGNAVSVRVTGTRHDTVLAFLSSGCKTCHAFWESFRRSDLPGGARLVIVTKGEDQESPVAVSEIAPPGVTVVMSTPAWEQYEVPGSPYVVHVEATTGRVRGEGTGADWDQVRRMLLDAEGDLRRRATRKASADARREREVDDVLLASGIRPGDPSLYPPTDPSDAP